MHTTGSLIPTITWHEQMCQSRDVSESLTGRDPEAEMHFDRRGLC